MYPAISGGTCGWSPLRADCNRVALAVAALGITDAERISRRTAAVSVLVADGVSAVASGIPFVVR